MIARADFRVRTARLKLQRARYHIEQITARIERYAREGTFVAVVESDESTGEQLVRVVQKKKVNLDEFSLMAGDCAHNLKSAIDHTVIYAAAHVGMPTRFSTITLPSGRTRMHFENRCNGLFKEVPWFANYMKLFEVFPEGKGTNLYYLTHLNNTDKHQFIIAAVQGHSHPNIEIVHSGGVKDIMSNNLVIGGGPDFIWATAPKDATIVIDKPTELLPYIYIDGNYASDILQVLDSLRIEVERFISEVEIMLGISGHIHLPADYLRRGFFDLQN